MEDSPDSDGVDTSAGPREPARPSRPPPCAGPVSGPPADKQPSIRPRKSSAPHGARWANVHRLLFAALWLVGQATLILTADRRADGAFGFRMFNESSTIKLTLYREIDRAGGRECVRVEGGTWTARAPDGMTHRLSWYDRIPRPYWVFDQEMHASYGAAAQLVRLQNALDDLAAHVPEDDETRRFVLEVLVRRNGREPALHRLTSRERPLSAPQPRPAEVARDGGP